MPREADPGLLEAAGRLGAIADFLVIPSNGAHLFQDEIERAAGKPVLSIIDVTLDELRRRGWTRVGVLALGEPVVYTRRLEALGVAREILEPERRAPLDGAIFRLMEGRDGDEERRSRARRSSGCGAAASRASSSAAPRYPSCSASTRRRRT